MCQLDQGGGREKYTLVDHKECVLFYELATLELCAQTDKGLHTALEYQLLQEIP
jgi:hypothetical protein